MAIVTRGSGNAIISPVMGLLTAVMKEEDNRQILQNDFKRMVSLLQVVTKLFGDEVHTSTFFPDGQEFVKIWLQLLQNSLTEAKRLHDRSRPRQSCLDCVVRNPRRLSKEIREWNTFFNQLYYSFQSDLLQHIIVVSGNNKISLVLESVMVRMIDVISPVMGLLTEVMREDDNHQILQTDLRPMESLLQVVTTAPVTTPFGDEVDTSTRLFGYEVRPSSGVHTSTLFQDRQEFVTIWWQLLQNSLTEAKRLHDRSRARQSCPDCIVRNPRRFSKEIREWNTFFNQLYDSFQSDFLQHMIVVSGNTMIRLLLDPVMELMTDVISKEGNRHILQNDFSCMDSLLQDITTLFRYEVNITTLFSQDQQKVALQTVRTRLHLLQNSLRKAKGLLSIDRSGLWRLSKDIRDWNAFFDQLHHDFQSDLSILLTSLQFALSRPLHGEKRTLLGDEDASGFVGSGIIDAEAQLERWLKEGDRVHLIGVYGRPRVGKTSLLKKLYNKYKYEVRNVFEAVIWVKVSQDYNILDLQSQMGVPLEEMSLDERKMRLSAHLKERKFLVVLDDLWSRFDLQELGVESGDGKHSKVLFSTRSKDLIGEMSPEEYIEIQPLSRDEGWMLFRRVAFKDGQVPMDIEERARRIADECKGVPSAINIVAAMFGQTSVDKWENCFSLLNNVDPSFPATLHLGGLDAELYTLLRWCYDALPNSEVRNCFLYCAMYQKGQEIDARQLVEMWIGEGLVKSKQETHVMDMAIGRKYLKLLLDRRFFQIVHGSTNVFRKDGQHDAIPSIRVHDQICDMAIYISQKEENCLFMARQNVLNFPQVQNENCTRISVGRVKDLPTELRFPKLACLTLEGNYGDLKELPSEFLLSLTSLRVLNLSGCTGITSVPTSVGQLRLLEFLSLRGTPIKSLPDEICHLPRLQFLDLSHCPSLISLPTEIGELKNLKHLNLDCIDSLKMIPREISKLTSLSRLQLSRCNLSVETEAQASIWSLKGLKNLTELEVWIQCGSENEMKSEIKDGIMGTWLEMRHLKLCFEITSSDVMMEDLPRDMQNMKNLQSFMLWTYTGLNLPNCKFEHLEMVELRRCYNIKELSRLEWLPNLKLLKLKRCGNVRELGIGRRGYLMLEKLVLKGLFNLESLGGASNTGVWDETTLPHLHVLKISHCRRLKRLPAGMEKLKKLSALKAYPSEWWESIMWEDESIKVKLQNIRKPYRPSDSEYW